MICFPTRFVPILGTLAMTFAFAGCAQSVARDAAAPAAVTDSTNAATEQSIESETTASALLVSSGNFRAESFRQTGDASWYASKFQGRRTANGERYDAHAMTAAHRTLPFGAYARVTSLTTGRSIVVRINDRGPFIRDRVIDLSYAAAAALGLPHITGKQVSIERLRKADVDMQAALND